MFSERHSIELISEVNNVCVAANKAFIALADEKQKQISVIEGKLNDEEKKIQNGKQASIHRVRSSASNQIADNERIYRDRIKKRQDSLEQYRKEFSAVESNNNPAIAPQLLDKYNEVVDIDNSIRNKMEKLNELEEQVAQLKIKQIELDSRIKDDERRKTFSMQLDALNKDFYNKNSRKKNSLTAELSGKYSDENIKSFKNMFYAMRPSFKGYTCPENIPEGFYLGDVFRVVTPENNPSALLESPVCDAVSQCCSEMCNSNPSEPLEIRLPYAQCVRAGLSMFASYSGNERRKFYQEKLQQLLLNLFMIFPPGKLEATMIDPKDGGSTFQIFNALGADGHSSIIDTKPWVSPSDIERAISVLRGKVETLISSYGDAYDEMVKREPFKVLCVTDFPKSFNSNALRDLDIILRNSRQYGIFVFIIADEAELGTNREINSSRAASGISASNNSVLANHPGLAEIYNNLTVISDVNGASYIDGVRFEFGIPSAPRKDIEQVIATLKNGIKNMKVASSTFEDMYRLDISDPNNWRQRSSKNGVSASLGIRGAGESVELTFGKGGAAIEHHAVIEGPTGSGKSTLLHTLIMDILMNYLPEEVRLYLVDFKEGTEFKPYAKYQLPALKIVAINSENEFGLNVLRELANEIENRAGLFRSNGYSDYNSYREGTGQKLPRIIMIFDEVQWLFSENPASGECASLIGNLINQGRSFGVHIILASQDFNLTAGLKDYFSSITVRIALRGVQSDSIILDSKNDGANQLSEGAIGQALFNDRRGREESNRFFRVAVVDPDKRDEYLRQLAEIDGHPALAEKYRDYKTRVLCTHADDDMFNAFNRLIVESKISKKYDGAKYPMFIGDGFETDRKFSFGLDREPQENLLVLGSDEKAALSAFYFVVLSSMYGNLSNDPSFRNVQRVYIVNMSDDDSVRGKQYTNFAHLSECFGKEIAIEDNTKKVPEFIDIVFRKMEERLENPDEEYPKLMFLFFGLNSVARIMTKGIYEDDTDSPSDKLRRILRDGPSVNINCVLWTETLDKLRHNLSDNRIDNLFSHWLNLSGNEKEVNDVLNIGDNTVFSRFCAVYRNVETDRRATSMRLYEVPSRDWVENFADAYHNIITDGKL